MASTGPRTERPIYVEYAMGTDRYGTETALTETVERRPVDNRNVWLEMDQIPATPPETTDGTNAYVRKANNVALTAVGGSTTAFTEAVADTFYNMVPASASSSDSTAYRPTLTDSAGTVVPYDPAVWVADGMRRRVEFKYGVPSAYTPPFTITYWRYTGEILSSSGGGGAFTVASGVIRPDTTAGATLATDDFVVGSDQLDADVADSTKDARVLFDKSTHAFRAGIAASDEWDAAKRGTNSVALGANGEAAADYSGSLSGHQNDANGAACVVAGGEFNVVTSDTTHGIYGWHTITGGLSNTITSADGSGNLISGGTHNSISGSGLHRNAIVGGGGNGSGNSVSGGSGSVVAGGDSNSITGGNGCAVLGGTTHAVGAGNNNVALGGGHATISGTAHKCAVIAGGAGSAGNTINGSAEGCVIVGGRSNTVGGSALSSAVVAGSTCSVTSATNAFAGGSLASAGHDRSFVWGGSSTGAAASTAAGEAIFRVPGGAHFYSEDSGTTGPYLDNGSADWTSSSSRTLKDLHGELDGEDALGRVARIPVYHFTYKGSAAKKEYIGPVAEDWHREFPSKKDPMRIGTQDPMGVTLACVRGLAARTAANAEAIAALGAGSGGGGGGGGSPAPARAPRREPETPGSPAASSSALSLLTSRVERVEALLALAEKRAVAAEKAAAAARKEVGTLRGNITSQIVTVRKHTGRITDLTQKVGTLGVRVAALEED
jgi:hypothetical protein